MNKSDINNFVEVGNLLDEWGERVKGARGTAIGDVTIDATEKISNCLELPSEFLGYIKEYRQMEGALQSITDYRDHFIHPFHVFCLGYIILNKWNKNKKNEIYNNLDENENDILKKWFVTSIYHDVGYPSEKFEILVKHFFKTSIGREVKSQFDWSSILLANDNIEHIKKLTELFNNKTKNQYGQNFEKWLFKRVVEDHDHGVLTALMLLNENIIHGFNWNENEKQKIVYEAALAIAIHNWKRPKNPDIILDLDQLNVRDFPLAFFLTFCDTAQEWGRRILLELLNKDRTLETLDDLRKLDSLLDKVEAPDEGAIVEIKYSSKWGDPVSGSKKLRTVYNDVGDKFESTWFSEGDNLKFQIYGVDKTGERNRSYIGPKIKVN